MKEWARKVTHPLELSANSTPKGDVTGELLARGCAACVQSWWRHQMEAFSALLALCVGNSPVPVNSPHKGQWRGALMFSLICARINDWVNNLEAGDLRRYRGHYDVIVMNSCKWCFHLCTRGRYHGQEQVISSHICCGIQLLLAALHTCFWHTIPSLWSAAGLWVLCPIMWSCIIKLNLNKL